MTRSCSCLLAAFLLVLGCSRSGAQSTNGYIVDWGNDDFGDNIPPSSLTEAAAIAAGYYHSVALRPNGTVAGWGSYSSSDAATPPPGLTGVRAVAAGGYHSLALRSNGTVVAWGLSDAYQTNVPPSLSGVRAIAAGGYHSLALRSNGTVVCWGSNSSHQTNVPPTLAGVSAIAAGDSHCVALQSNGVVICWGNDTSHQCEAPDANLYRFKAIGAGLNHSLGVFSNGTVMAWGQNYFGQCTPPGGLSGVIAVAGGENFSLALLANHRLVGWGDDSVHQLEAPLTTNLIAISTSFERSLALAVTPVTIAAQPSARQSVLAGTNVVFSVGTAGGLPICYQWFKDGVALADGTNSSYSLASVSNNNSGTYYVIVSNPTGTATSSNAALAVNYLPSITGQPSGFVRLAGEGPITFSVGASGTALLCYHWRKDGVDVAPPQTNSTYTIWIVQLELAGNYTCVVTNSFGSVTSAVATLAVRLPPAITNQPQNLSVYAGTMASFLVGASNATSYQWHVGGVDIPDATNAILTIPNASATDAGDYSVRVFNPWAHTDSSSAKLTVNPIPPSTNRILAYGQQVDVWTGSGYADLSTPTGLGNVVALSAGMYHSLALCFNGAVVGWGDNTYGQAGPTAGLVGVNSMSAGGYHSLALTNGGLVAGWGANSAGQATPPPSATNIVAVAAGGNHSFALRRNGTLVAWGTNDFGQGMLPTSITSNFMAIAAGFQHNLVLRSNGTVAAWGRNNEYQTLIPQALTNPASAGVAAVAAGGYHCLVLRSNGTVTAWGAGTMNLGTWPDYGQSIVPPGLTNVVAIAAGYCHSLALRRDGSVVGWGLDNYGQTDIPPGLTGVMAIAAGGNRSLLLVPKHLLLLPLQVLSGGGISLFLGNDDGSVVDVTKLEIRATTNLALNFTNWVRYTNGFVLQTNGLIRWDDPNAAGLRWRYYRTVQKP